jgi:hypothetical protein
LGSSFHSHSVTHHTLSIVEVPRPVLEILTLKLSSKCVQIFLRMYKTDASLVIGRNQSLALFSFCRFIERAKENLEDREQSGFKERNVEYEGDEGVHKFP